VARAVGAQGFVRRRLGELVLVWLGVTVFAFGLATLAPGDPAQMMLLHRTGEVPSVAEVDALRRELGLDAPLPLQYLRWLGDAMRGDFGTSYRTGDSVARALSARFPATLLLAATAVLVGLVLSVPLGVIAAARKDSAIDHGARFLALTGASIPSFWLAYLLILLLAVLLGLLPVAGYGGWRELILPALTLGMGDAAVLTRLTRATVLEELGEDYVRTARSKGLSPWRVVTRHALRNALNPIVTLSGVRLGRLMGQAVIVELVFAWPGIGRYLIEAIYDRDYPVIQGFVMYMGTVFVLVHLLVDVAYTRLDPRVRIVARLANRHG
jgi:peptide/nickel transport system permease protein